MILNPNNNLIKNILTIMINKQKETEIHQNNKKKIILGKLKNNMKKIRHFKIINQKTI